MSQVTDLRAQLVLAGITSGKYMTLTELAESGAADIGVGVTFVGYWTQDHLKVGSLSSGLDSINQGADKFAQLSRTLSSL